MGVAAAEALTKRNVNLGQAASWFDRAMNWAQVAFTEDDPGKHDLAMWLPYFKKIHSDVAASAPQERFTRDTRNSSAGVMAISSEDCARQVNPSLCVFRECWGTEGREFEILTRDVNPRKGFYLSG